VSAGLAVGTFCGLLFGVGTGDGGPPSAGARDAGAAAPDAAVVAVVDVAPDAAEVADVEEDAGSGVADDPEIPVATLTFKVSPPGLEVEITVDNETVEDNSVELELEEGKKTVKIVAKAKGFRTLEKRLSVDRSQTVPLLMRKKGGDGPSGPRPPGPIIDL